jgi:hypothetical protein
MRHIEPMYLVTGRLTVATCYKVARTSLLSTSDSFLCPREEIPTKDIIAVVREPFERLQSTYQFMRQQDLVASYEAFVDMVLDGYFITEPQTNVHTHDRKYIPTILVPFENINKAFPDLPRLNSSRKELVDATYRQEEVRHYYADDTKLYASSKG